MMSPITFLSDIMIQSLNFFYNIIPNWGVAIILLTLATKLLLHPLTRQSLVQMDAVHKIQPKIKELQKKYKESPKELQQRTMELYQQEKVNPLGGCLPMLLQLPIFIALFFAVRDMNFAGTGASFLWITNFSTPDPTYILVALIAISTYLTQKTMPQPAESSSQAMMVFMPAFIAFVSAPFPAGVQLYWLAQTVITAAQQAIVLRGIKGGARNG